MSKWIAKVLLPLTLLLAAGVIAAVVWSRARDEGAARQPERLGFQEADQPPEMPPSGRLDPRFALLGGWQRAAVPMAAACAAPTASWQQRAVAGEEVLAVADGWVVFAGQNPGGTGAAVVLAHRGADGGGFHSVYPGLARLEVARGRLVARGARLGNAGEPGCAVALRLADEVHPGLAPADSAGAPGWLANDDPAALAPSALAIALRPADDPWSILQADSPRAAERLLEILSRENSKD